MSTHALPADELIARLGPLLAAEAVAETSGSGAEPGDLEQAVWLRLLERLSRGGPPADPPLWLRRAIRAESRRIRRTVRRETALTCEPADAGRH
ncbi:sigma-70 family RNA polymerase sigma factor, partial [Streptomyces sp. SID4956]|nr:sigma-70 family RNA polymerase sigma factor [Streptomyces sp. SID4956]